MITCMVRRMLDVAIPREKKKSAGKPKNPVKKVFLMRACVRACAACMHVYVFMHSYTV